MNDCIYTGHCTYKKCDLACPAHAETKYWLDRCEIYPNDTIFSESQELITAISNILENKKWNIGTYFAKDTLKVAKAFCYCAVCLYGRGTAFSGGVYNLNFHKYVDEIKKSWNTRYETDWLEYARLWSMSSDYLIISHMDYIKFNDFESQTLLSILQERSKPDKTTVVVVPKLNQIVGDGNFYATLINKLKEVAIK